MIRHYSDIHELLCYWGAWRNHGTACHQGGNRVIHHKAPPEKAYYRKSCPTCHGRGKVKDETGTQVTCPYPRCKNGGYLVVYDKVDPRMIPATGAQNAMYVVYSDKPPPEYEQIDSALFDMYLAMAAVILAHYVYYPSYGKDHIKRISWVNERLEAHSMPRIDGITFYEATLRGARQRLATRLKLPVRHDDKKDHSSRGGKTAARNMTAAERTSRARNASNSRWRETLHLKKKITRERTWLTGAC